MNDSSTLRMNALPCCLLALFAITCSALAEIKISEEDFGKSLGGWKKGRQTAEYPLSGSLYRTYRPEISPTPEGGIFVSVRIDHVRGWLSSDDHAMLEVTVGPQGIISSAKSNIAIQGRSIASEVILGTNEAGKELSGANRAVQIGTDLVSDLTAKLLRENIVEAGRVSFPAAIRHNYNLLYQAVRVNGVAIQPLQVVLPPQAPSAQAGTATATHTTTVATEPGSAPASTPPPEPTPSPEEPKPPVAKPVPGHAEVEIQPFPADGGSHEVAE